MLEGQFALTFQRAAQEKGVSGEVLLQKLNETDIAASIRSNNVSVVDRASAPQYPVRPQKRRSALAGLLIRVINLRSFNWTIFFYWEGFPYLMAAAVAVLASVGAAVYPIWKVYRTYPQLQIREE